MDPAPEVDGAALRRLARSLVWDRERAEDVVQEAWLADLRSDRRAGGLPGWIFGAVRRIARNRRRDEQRRAAREQGAARPESQSSAAEVSARLEVLRRLVEAVERLDEPYRTAIVQRFFDALPPREIAQRSGLPVNTVRTHVRRGLAHLRRDLDGPDGRGRESFLAALLPLAGPMPWRIAPFAPSAAGTVSTSLGVALVNKQVLTAAAAVLLLTLGWFALRTPAARPQSAPDARAEVLAQVPVEPVETLARPEAAEVAAEARVAVAVEQPARTWVHRGRITSGYFDPLPHGRLHGRVLRGAGLDGETRFEQRFSADASGVFEWALEPPEEVVTLVLVADMDGHLCTPTWGTYGPGYEAWEPWTIQALPLDVTVTGRVIDDAGRPVAGARVIHHAYERDREVTSNGDGGFQVRLSSAHSQGRLSVVAAGFAIQQAEFLLASPGALPLPDVVLVAERRVRGRILDEAGVGVEGAEVSADWRRDVVELSLADGSFELPALDPNEPRTVISVRKPGHVLTQVTLEPEVSEIEIRLAHAVRVSGRVVAPDGTPLPNAAVQLGNRTGSTPEARTHTDELGRFELEPVPVGFQFLWVFAQGLAQRRFDLVVPEAASVVAAGDIRLSPEYVLQGVVLDPQGSPLPWAMVYVESPPRILGAPEVYDLRTHSDEAGRFRIPGLPGVAMTVGVLARGYTRLERTLESPDEPNLILRPEPAGSLAGRVVAAETGQPIADFVVRLVPLDDIPREQMLWGFSSSWMDGVAIHDAQGLWRLDEDVPADRWVAVQVEAEGYAPARVERAVSAVDPDPEACVARLGRATSVRGRVVRQGGGEPVAGARVLYQSSVDAPAPSARSGRPYYEAVTDAAGGFELAGLPTGTLALRVEADGFAVAIDGPFEVRDGRTSERWIELDPGGRVHGRLLDAAGRPRAGEVVSIYCLEGRTRTRTQQTRTDPEGAFALAGLSRGTFHVRWERELGGRTLYDLVRLVELEGEEDLELDLRPAGSGSVRGSLVFVGPTPPIEVVMVLRQPSPDEPPPIGRYARSARAAFAEQGAFTVEGLEPGKYSFIVQHQRDDGTFLAGSALVEVGTGSDIEVVIDVASPGQR